MRLPLTHLPFTLIESFGDSPNYRAVYEAARSGVIPATISKSGRWTWEAGDLAVIAKRLGLTPSDPNP